MMDHTDKRTSARRRTIFGGAIFSEDGQKWECSVSDISETGVKIRTKAKLEIGTNVELKINKFNDLRRCEVSWTTEKYLGLRFLIAINPDDEAMAGLFKFTRPD